MKTVTSRSDANVRHEFLNAKFLTVSIINSLEKYNCSCSKVVLVDIFYAVCRFFMFQQNVLYENSYNIIISGTLYSRFNYKNTIKLKAEDSICVYADDNH